MTVFNPNSRAHLPIPERSVSEKQRDAIREIVEPPVQFGGAILPHDVPHVLLIDQITQGLAQTIDLPDRSKEEMLRGLRISHYRAGILMGMKIGSLVFPEVRSVGSVMAGESRYLFGRNEMTPPLELLDTDRAVLSTAVEHLGRSGLTALRGADESLDFVVHSYVSMARPVALSTESLKTAAGVGIALYGRAAAQGAALLDMNLAQMHRRDERGRDGWDAALAELTEPDQSSEE